MTTNLIQEGDQVIFRRDGSSRVFQIRRKRQVYFEKNKFNVDELIGEPYGSTFELDRGKLMKVSGDKGGQLQIDEITVQQGADNRNLHDSDSNQKMSKEDIMKMKEEGITGKELIGELIENSETFKTKTEFSQAKYLKKKKQKHMTVFTVLRPTARLVMDIFAKEPAKICYLRPDTLSQLLCYSNVMCGSKVAVVETCQGLVLACIMQRMGGQGKLVQLIPNENNAVCRQVVDYFGFPKEHLDNLYSFPLDKLSSLGEQDTCEDSTAESPLVKPTELTAVETTSQSTISESAASTQHKEKSDAIGGSVDSKDIEKSNKTEECEISEGQEVTSTGNGEEEVETRSDVSQASGDVKLGEKRRLGPQRELQRKQRALRQKEAGNIIKSKELDSLILACKYDPAPILMKMLEFLLPSRPVVVFCQFLEPLVDCYKQIKEKHIGLQLKLSETWFRQYQVLPQRTHPMMNMSGTGGYLLTFMTAEPGPSKSGR